MLNSFSQINLEAWQNEHLQVHFRDLLLSGSVEGQRFAATYIGLADPTGLGKGELFHSGAQWLELHGDDRSAETVAKIVYISSRKRDSNWGGIYKYLRKHIYLTDGEFKDFCFISDQRFDRVPSVIRQCRPDKKLYALREIEQVGLFNKNRSVDYFCYDKSSAYEYLQKFYGRDIAALFNIINTPQAESDFFLVASLLRDGGVSADVCSVGRAPIAKLVNSLTGLGIVERNGGIEKNFLCAPSGHPVVSRYFQTLVSYLDMCLLKKISPDYKEFSSRWAFEACLCDMFSENFSFSEDASITLIDGSIYDGFIEASGEEENLTQQDVDAPFARIRLSGIASPSIYKNSIRAESVVGMLPGAYYPPSDNVTIIGEDRVPHILQQIHAPIAVPPLKLFQCYELGVSGHGCCWHEGQFLRLESYLSFVAESETLGGHWMRPSDASDIRYVDEPAIVAFGAGYGCYGHYLVDDVPRIALARRILGDKAFADRKIVIPQKTPGWAINVLKILGRVNEEQFLFFDHEREFLKIRDALVPSFGHRDYRFHPFVKEYYQSLSPADVTPTRRICLSRRAWEPNKVNQRVFEQQDLFEDMARQRGFDVIAPETLPLMEQIRLIAETRCQIGEHGSAQHASIYNRYGMTVGTINPLTEIQTNLGRIYGDTNVIVFADGERRDEAGNTFFSISLEKLEGFFDAVMQQDMQRWG